MRKLNKMFEVSDFTIESMSCTLTCICHCGTPFCQCTTISDYSAITVSVEQSTYARTQKACDATDEITMFELLYG